MAFNYEGLIDNTEKFGKMADFYTRIKKIGWRTTPFLSSIASMATTQNYAEISSGHHWFYDIAAEAEAGKNAQIEGGAFPKATNFKGEQMTNHYQIVQHVYGITDTEKKAATFDGKAVLARQYEQTIMRHNKKIEQILLSEQNAVKRVKDQTAGECGGLFSFATANNTIDAQNAELSWSLLRELLKIGYMKGGEQFKVLMMNDKQKDALDDILFSKTYANNFNVKALENNITEIGQTAYGSNIKVVLSPYIPNDKILAYIPEDIVKVNWRLQEQSEKGKDRSAMEKIITSEFTLRVTTPYAFAVLKNLKTA